MIGLLGRELMNNRIITNAAPMLTWTVTALLTHPGYLREFRFISERYVSHSDSKDLEFDIPGFCAEPFIQGVWKKALRLGVTSALASVVAQDLETEGYSVKKGSVILMPVRIMHFEPDVFEDPWTFNPWRWVSANEQTTGLSSPKAGKASPEQLKRQNKSLRPFDGDTGVCSGQFVAEQVMMGAAILFYLFDFKSEPRQEIPRPNSNPRGQGATYPLVDPKVNITRRNV